MSEKRKNDKVKNQPSSASTRTAFLLLGAMLVIGVLAAVSLVIIKPAPSVPDSMIEEVTPTN